MIWVVLSITVVLGLWLIGLTCTVVDQGNDIHLLTQRPRAIELPGPKHSPVCECGGTWGKWETGKAKNTVRYISGDTKTTLEESQWRTCTECGFIEKRKIG